MESSQIFVNGIELLIGKFGFLFIKVFINLGNRRATWNWDKFGATVFRNFVPVLNPSQSQLCKSNGVVLWALVDYFFLQEPDQGQVFFKDSSLNLFNDFLKSPSGISALDFN